jgi:hypothetical protein
MSARNAGTYMIVLPGGGYAEHAPHEAEPVAEWLGEIGVQASVFRYPLTVPRWRATGSMNRRRRGRDERETDELTDPCRYRTGSGRVLYTCRAHR